MRNQDYKTKKRERKKKRKEHSGQGDAISKDPEKGSKIKAYDYRSWDKFDVVS